MISLNSNINSDITLPSVQPRFTAYSYSINTTSRSLFNMQCRMRPKLFKIIFHKLQRHRRLQKRFSRSCHYSCQQIQYHAFQKDMIVWSSLHCATSFEVNNDRYRIEISLKFQCEGVRGSLVYIFLQIISIDSYSPVDFAVNATWFTIKQTEIARLWNGIRRQVLPLGSCISCKSLQNVQPASVVSE